MEELGNTNYLAHGNQSLESHLLGVAEICRKNSEKVGCGEYGELLGLLHDFGKYSQDFQKYINDSIKQQDPAFNPDEDEDFVDARGLKGKIDHSTAGAQLIWQSMAGDEPGVGTILSQLLSHCLVSHHSGMIDCLSTDQRGTVDVFTKRIKKEDRKTHLSECMARIDPIIQVRVDDLIQTKDLAKPLEAMMRSILRFSLKKSVRSTVVQFQLGLFSRFLFSCLIDADRQDTADSEKPHAARMRQKSNYLGWQVLIDRLENHLTSFLIRYPIDSIRRDVSASCLEAAKKDRGLFTLTVPTGGGKTLASLRFALHHAHLNSLDRVIYVIPFTTIIDQNAEVVRSILEPSNVPAESGRIVLEHHSNVGAEKQGWKEKLLTVNWDAPVIFTTMVQLLEVLFGSGTRGARRMHQLARAVIIFDEIQTLPIRCVHMFCNAINFLVNQCGSTVVLCTATQPLLGEVDPQKGSLNLTKENEIIPDVQSLFDDLRRVEVIDLRVPGGWSQEKICEKVIEEGGKTKSCLVVVNLKKQARSLFGMLEGRTDIPCFHLSTGMCPNHRKAVLREVRSRLDQGLPTICVSTQLIEAGVDVNFGTVVRFLAGLDSIAQAAGRCNRNGASVRGHVFVVNPSNEQLDSLKDISTGRDKAERVLNDFKENPEKYRDDPIGPDLLKWYYQNYFFARKNEMSYPLEIRDASRLDTIFNLLSVNMMAVEDYKRAHRTEPAIFLRQAFRQAAEAFKSIDAPTQSVIVQFGEEGTALVGQLSASFNLEKQFDLLRIAQQFTINLFPHEFKKLEAQQAMFRVQADTEIFALKKEYYHRKTGLSLEPVNEEERFDDFLNA